MFKKNGSRLLALSAVLVLSQASWAADPAPNGLTLPEGYKDWRMIASSHRADNNTLRVILGNDIAVQAAREGNTNPWPDGTVMGKLVWKVRADDNWPQANVPGEFVHAEFMYKDAAKYADTAGWGWARWVGQDEKPFGEDASFSSQCVGCHTPVAERDYVFTTPALIP